MDIKLGFDNREKRFDLAMGGADMATDEGLETAVVLSLFTDRRAEADDELPDGGEDRRGWWADVFAGTEGDRFGSRLWLLSREKALSSVAARARQYAEEALAWMIEDGIAAAVEVETEIRSGGILAMGIRISRPDGSAIDFRFDNLWEALNGV